MCGKDSNSSIEKSCLTGSPPLAREGLLCVLPLVSVTGITPARAGRTVKGDEVELHIKDHPRSRGKD